MLLFATATAARAVPPSALTLYARARIADAGQSAGALAAWRAVLTDQPAITTIAYRAYRAGVAGGDEALAVRAAQALDRAGTLPPDAAMLLIIAALKDRDWVQARARLTGLAADPSFGFVAAILMPWVPGELDRARGLPRSIANAYRAEIVALQAVAQGDAVAGSAAIRALWATDPYRANSLRIAAAATLARHDLSRAAALLTGDDRSTAVARALIMRGQRMPVCVDTPARAAGFVLARMAGDLIVADAGRTAITLARFATFADPANPRFALIAAGALAAAKRPQSALALADQVRGDPVYGDDAASLRIDLLEATGDATGARAAAAARSAQSANDRARLGDLAARSGDPQAAVRHYRAVLAVFGEAQAGASLWLALGNAEDSAGNWPAARAAFERAVSIEPDDARTLNQLGYGMAKRGQDLPAAIMLLDRAARLQPGNAAITDSIGLAELKRGQVGRAIALLEQARLRDAIEPDIGEHLGDAYWSAGRHIEARYAWRAALDTAEGAQAARVAGKITRGLP